VEIVYCPEARDELLTLPPAERKALLAAVEKLETLADRLRFPHSSAVKGAGATLRELRPRGGRSPWRVFYRRVGNRMVIGAIGPEAESDPRGFRRSVAAALDRIERFEIEERP
jgi:hypothetical protein